MKVKEILILIILGYFAVTKIEAVSFIDKRVLKNHPCMYAPVSCFRKRATLIPQIPQDILKSAMLKVNTFLKVGLAAKRFNSVNTKQSSNPF